MHEPTRILLLGPGDDESLQAVHEALERAGSPPLRLDPGAFPADLLLTVDGTRLSGAGRRLDDVRAVYLRRPEAMSPVPSWEPDEGRWAALKSADDLQRAVRHEQEIRSVRSSLHRLMSERAMTLPSYELLRARRMLPAWLRRLEAAGLPVPPFVCGNDLEQSAYFVEAHAQDCRARRIWEPAAQERRADHGFLVAQHESFDRHPWLIRARVGRRALRVLALDGEVLAHCGGLSRLSAGEVERVEELTRRALTESELRLAALDLELSEQGEAWLIGLEPDPELASWPSRRVDPAAQVAAALREPLETARAADRPVPRRASLPLGTASAPLRIGIAGRGGDTEVRALAQALTDRGAEPALIELPLFPGRRALHATASGGCGGGEVLDGLGAVFLRTTGFSSPLPSPEEGRAGGSLTPGLRERVNRVHREQGECFAFKYALLESLGGLGIPVINPPRGQEVHRAKVWQLASLAAAGLPVPPTLASNDRAACERFVEAQGGPERVVLKPLAGIYKTRLLSRANLDEALERGPVILQRYVGGDTIRTYIVGGRLVGAGRILHSGRTVDSSEEQAGVELVQLPEEAIADGARAAQHLGLSWTGMDFQRDEETGRCWILECNASAMFTAFSRLTGCDVPGALADLLLELAVSPATRQA